MKRRSEHYALLSARVVMALVLFSIQNAVACTRAVYLGDEDMVVTGRLSLSEARRCRASSYSRRACVTNTDYEGGMVINCIWNDT